MNATLLRETGNQNSPPILHKTFIVNIIAVHGWTHAVKGTPMGKWHAASWHFDPVWVRTK